MSDATPLDRATLLDAVNELLGLARAVLGTRAPASTRWHAYADALRPNSSTGRGGGAAERAALLSALYETREIGVGRVHLGEVARYVHLAESDPTLAAITS